MVSPSPYLDNKIENTSYLLRGGNLHLVNQYSRDYPHDYLDLDTHTKLMANKPWADKVERLKGRRRTDRRQNEARNGVRYLQQESLQVSPPVLTNSDRVLVLCVDFSDKIATIPVSTIANRFFGSSGYTFKNFYTENSYGQYIPEGVVYGWYRLPNTYSYYIGGNNGTGNYPQNSQKMVEDALDAITNDPTVDLNYIDRDSNGNIDRLMVIHSGGEASWAGSANEIWAHAWMIIPSKVVRGKTFTYYATTSEYLTGPGDTQRSGIDSHEYGHLLGLPDLYDTSGTSYGIGKWSVMSYGSWGNNGVTPVHFDMWCKIRLGWVTTQLNKTGTLTLRNSENYQDTFKYDTSVQGEYFLLENRQSVLFDVYLPGNGMLIWHINENATGNSNRDCLLVGLVQADNANHLYYKSNQGDAGDPYPGTTGNRVFSKDSLPNAILCDGTKRDITLDQISDSSATMTFRGTITCLLSYEFTIDFLNF